VAEDVNIKNSSRKHVQKFKIKKKHVYTGCIILLREGIETFAMH